MEFLFPGSSAYPSGFSYHPEFLSRKEEEELLAICKSMELHTFIFQGYEAKRKVASFGFDYSFDNRTLSKGKEIPKEFEALMLKVASYFSVSANMFEELLVTQYPPESVINWHRDAPPFEIIVGISLQADCIFKLRPHDKAKQTRKNIISLPVQRRSMYMISGEARTDWQHSTAPVQSERFSITLRTLKS